MSILNTILINKEVAQVILQNNIFCDFEITFT